MNAVADLLAFLVIGSIAVLAFGGSLLHEWRQHKLRRNAVENIAIAFGAFALLVLVAP
ncbi:hypothetical protein MASR1M8_16140 [Thermomonas brevis]